VNESGSQTSLGRSRLWRTSNFTPITCFAKELERHNGRFHN
jgi:hypothetical protein